MHDHDWTPWGPLCETRTLVSIGGQVGEEIDGLVVVRLCESFCCGGLELRLPDGTTQLRDMWDDNFPSEDGLCGYCKKPCASIACYSCRLIYFGDKDPRESK